MDINESIFIPIGSVHRIENPFKRTVKKANNVDIKRVRPITFMRLSKELYLPSDRIKPQIENKIN